MLLTNVCINENFISPIPSYICVTSYILYYVFCARSYERADAHVRSSPRAIMRRMVFGETRSAVAVSATVIKGAMGGPVRSELASAE